MPARNRLHCPDAAMISAARTRSGSCRPYASSGSPLSQPMTSSVLSREKSRLILLTHGAALPVSAGSLYIFFSRS